jgi:diguanylate cyclase (GGDEF)-like protein
MATKLRLVLLAVALIPQAVVYGMAFGSPVATDRYFNQIQAASLASALLLALASPGLVSEWLVGKPLREMSRFCARLKLGNYRERLPLPNEARDGDGEDGMTVLMRDMNWMARQIEIRERELRQAIDELSASRRLVGEKNAYLVKVNRELAVTHDSLQERTRELEQLCRQMQVMAMTDSLTAIANRRCFFDALRRPPAAVACSCPCPPLSLLVFDVDRFKAVNDTFGHEAGDRVLRDIAAIIRENTREGDLAARIGGEEYALLLPGASARQAEEVACRIQMAVAGRVIVLADGRQISVTVSIGVCTLSQHVCLDREKLYGFADQALYHAKRSGRNSISVYDCAACSLRRVDCA